MFNPNNIAPKKTMNLKARTKVCVGGRPIEMSVGEAKALYESLALYFKPDLVETELNSAATPTNLERLTKAKSLLEAAAAEIHAVHATGKIDLKRTSVLASAFCRAHDAKEELIKTFFQ